MLMTASGSLSVSFEQFHLLVLSMSAQFQFLEDVVLSLDQFINFLINSQEEPLTHPLQLLYLTSQRVLDVL